MVGKFLSLCHVVQNGVGDKARLVLLVERAVDLDRCPLRVLGPQRLALALGVVFDDGVGRVQNGLGAAVVLLQADDLGVAVLVFKIQDVLDGGAAELVDALVVVADHADVLMSARQQADQQKLGVVGVLILVHHDVAEAVAVFFQHVGVLLENFDGKDDDVVKVQRVCRFQPLLVVAVDLADHLLAVVAVCLPQHVLRGEQLVLGRADRGQNSLWRHHLFLDGQLLERLLDDAHRVVGVVDGEAALISQRGDLPSENAHAGRMEGGSLDVQCLLAQHRLQPLL